MPSKRDKDTGASRGTEALFAGPGEIRALGREHAWAATPLGPVEQWPLSLRIAVRLCLDSRYPMAVWAGLELVLIYNEGYPPVLGATKHPWAFGRPGREVWSEVWDRLGPELEAVVTRGESTYHEDQRFVLHREGRHEETSFDYSFTPIQEDDGRVVGALNVFRETTQQKRAEAQLRESARRKDEFLAMLGHELRNPLAAIRHATELLKRSETRDARLDKACGILDRQSTHVARLVDGLLDVSRVVRGMVQLESERLDLREVVAGVLEDSEAAIAERGLELRKQPSTEPLWIRGDKSRLTQIFDNLVGNAIRFTNPPGSITVSLDRDEEHAVVRVRDTGVGIDREMLERIFDSFEQAPQDTARSSGGLGLGLSLTKGLVELHDGTIEAHSEGPGAGTEVRVRFPLASAPPEVAERPATTGERAHRILVVEDNADAAEALRDLLELEGHDVTVARSGVDALEALRARGADLVLCDVGLPGAMDGNDLARAIREDPSLRDIPLLALTGYGQADDRQRTAEAGFDEHLTKPLDFQALEEAIERLVSGSGRLVERGRRPMH